MRTIKPSTRGRPLWRTVLLVLAATAVGVAGTVAGLAALKVIDPAKLAFWNSKDTIPAGWIPIPICARPIPAYTTVTRDYLIDPKTGRWLVDYRPPEAVPKSAITDISKIRGRVTAREKAAPFYFGEADFLPEGTRPGVVGGTPHGKRAITLDAGKLKGVHELKEGDHVDLLASIAVDMPGTGRSNFGRSGTSVLATPDTTLLPKRSIVRPLVQDGVVVAPVRTRNAPISASSLTQGTTTRTMPVQEIVLAVDPQEVAPLAEAMDLKYEITCVARSGRPASGPATTAPPSTARGLSEVFAALGKIVVGAAYEADADKAMPARNRARIDSRGRGETAAGGSAARDITPGLNPMAETRYMEVMIGTQRQFVLFTGPGNSPVVALQDDGSAKGSSGVVPAGVVEESRQ